MMAFLQNRNILVGALCDELIKELDGSPYFSDKAKFYIEQLRILASQSQTHWNKTRSVMGRYANAICHGIHNNMDNGIENINGYLILEQDETRTDTAGYARGLVQMLDTQREHILRNLNDVVSPNTGILHMKWSSRAALSLCADASVLVWLFSVNWLFITLETKHIVCMDIIEILHLIDVRSSQELDCMNMDIEGLVYDSAQFKGLVTGGNVSLALE